MINNKIPVIIGNCWLIGVASAMQPFSVEPGQLSTLKAIPNPGVRYNFDSLSNDTKTAIYAAIDSVTLGKGKPRSEVISSGFIVGNIKDTISYVVINEVGMKVYFPAVKAYRVRQVRDDISEFSSFEAGSITITRGERDVILNEREQLLEEPQNYKRKLREDEFLPSAKKRCSSDRI